MALDLTTKWRLTAMLIYMLVVNVNRVKTSEELMVKMSKTFFKALADCKKELSISDNVVQDVVKFWDEGSKHGDRQLGCLLLCLAHRQDIIHTEKHVLNHDNAQQFTEEHGADESTAKQIVGLIHECEKQWADVEDHCTRVLEVARCFRDHMHRLNWAPSIEVLIGEILAEFASDV